MKIKQTPDLAQNLKIYSPTLKSALKKGKSVRFQEEAKVNNFTIRKENKEDQNQNQVEEETKSKKEVNNESDEEEEEHLFKPAPKPKKQNMFLQFHEELYKKPQILQRFNIDEQNYVTKIENLDHGRYITLSLFYQEYDYNFHSLCLPYSNKLRYFFIILNEWKTFDHFILLCILVNSAFLATNDYKNETSQWNQTLESVGNIFTVIFIVEAGVKTVAQGFYFGKYAYLSDNWNKLDFLIVVSAILEFILQDLQVNMKVIRTLRVLRPLKTINAIPEIRTQVATLIQSLPNLGTVVLFLGFLILLLGILGLQLFSGFIYPRCRLTNQPVNATYWPFDPSIGRICSPTGQGLFQCPETQYCAALQDYGLDPDLDMINLDQNVQFGIASFDNIFQSILAVFQIITNDSWTLILFNLQDSTGSYIPVVYCCAIVLICSFFSLNLVLAVVMESYQNHKDLEDQEALKKAQEAEENEKKWKQLKIDQLKSQNIQGAKAQGFSRQRTLQENIEFVMEERAQMIQEIKYNRAMQILGLAKGGSTKPVSLSKQITIRQNAFKRKATQAENFIRKKTQFRKLNQLQIITESRNSQTTPSLKFDNSSQQTIPKKVEFSQESDIGEDSKVSYFEEEGEEEIKEMDEQSQGFQFEGGDEEETKQEEQKEEEKLEDSLDQMQLQLPTLGVTQHKSQSQNKKDQNQPKEEMIIEKGDKKFFGGFKFAKLGLNKSKNDLPQKPESENQNFSKSYKAPKINIFEGNAKINGKQSPFLANIQNEVQKTKSIPLLVQKMKAKGAIKFQAETLLKKMEFALKKKTQEKKKLNYGVRNEEDMKKKAIESLQQAIKEQELQLKTENSEQQGIHLSKTSSEKSKFLQLKQKAHMGFLEQKNRQIREQRKEEKQKAFQEQVSSSIKTFLEVNYLDEAKIRKEKESIGKSIKLDKQEKRAKDYKIVDLMQKISNSKLFQYLIILAILVNTIFLSLDKYPENLEIKLLSEKINLACSALFLLELLIRLTAQGFNFYFLDKYNCLDALVVIVSAIDFAMNLTLQNKGQFEGQGAISALRAFRLLRVFKLLKNWPNLQNLLETIFQTLISIAYFSLLLSLLIYIYTILGMDLFSYEARFNKENEIDLENGEYPNQTINNFFEGFITVFIVLTNDGWSSIYFNYYRSTNPILATCFFFSLLFIGQYILLNLFLSILIDRFEKDSQDQKTRQKVEKLKETVAGQEQDLIEKVFSFLDKYLCQIFCAKIKKNLKKRKDIKLQNSMKGKQIKEYILSDQLDKNKALNLFSLKNGFRKFLRSWILPGSEELEFLLARRKRRMEELELVREEIKERSQNIDNQLNKSLILQELEDLKEKEEKLKPGLIDKEAEELEQYSPTFEYFIIILIAASSVQLTLENPLNNPDGKLAEVLLYLDIVLTSFFILEALVKNIAFGFLLNGKNSYLRKTWNQIDFLIVILSIVDLVFQSNLAIFKVFRLFRVLRPLRIISRNEGLKISIQALIISIPEVFGITILSMFFFVVFGIIGVNYLKGRYFSCQYQEFEIIDINDIYDCLNTGAYWKNFPINFDSLPNAIMTLFAMAAGSGWSDKMYRGIASRGPNLEPQRQHQPFMAFFYIFFMIISSFFMINLFVGVIISTYNRERENLGNQFLITDNQKKWVEAKLLIMKAQPILAFIRPDKTKPFRRACFDSVRNKKFEAFIMICIVLNSIVLAFNYYEQSESYQRATEVINYVFLGIFTFECCLKMSAYGKRYFRDGWNLFDFLIVVGAYLGLFISSRSKLQVGLASTTLRAFRIARILKLFRKSKNLQVIFRTFIRTFPAMANVGGLMLLFVYIYAVLGVFLFAPIKLNAPLDQHVNFQDISSSILTLFRASTGESWHMVYASLSKKKELNFQCEENPSYTEYMRNGKETVGCGHKGIAGVYFFSFCLLISIIFLNLFIAIILSGFTESSNDDSKVFNEEQTSKFKVAWSNYDPNAKSFIKQEFLGDLLKDLGHPFGIKSVEEDFDGKEAEFQTYLETLKELMIKMHENFKDKEEAKKEQKEKGLYFGDVLECLTLEYILSKELKKLIDQKKSEDEKSKGLDYILDLDKQVMNISGNKRVKILQRNQKYKTTNKRKKRVTKTKSLFSTQTLKDEPKNTYQRSRTDENEQNKVNKILKEERGAGIHIASDVEKDGSLNSLVFKDQAVDVSLEVQLTAKISQIPDLNKLRKSPQKAQRIHQNSQSGLKRILAKLVNKRRVEVKQNQGDQQEIIPTLLTEEK